MKNKVIIFPTDTVYGIGASVFDVEGMNKIYDIKKRPHNKPLAVLCKDIDQINEIAYVSDIARALIEKYLPGALTLILPARDNIKKTMNIDTVGVRIPNSKIALNILAEMGPLATTSVNDSGETPMNEYSVICDKYAGIVDKIYDSNEASSNISSTVIIVNENGIKLIREGQIRFCDLLNAVNCLSN